MILPSYQSLSPQKQRMGLILGGAVVLLGILALIAGLVFNPQDTSTNPPSPSSKNTLPPLTSGVNTPEPTLQKSLPANSNISAYPTPTPTPNQIYDYFKNALPTDIPPTPTPTPLKGAFYTPNGKQNDLTILLHRKNEWNILDEIQLINTKTKEIRPMGQAYEASPGDSAFFSSNFSSVIFIGSKLTDPDYEKISFYSIPQNKITKQISLADMKKAIPALILKQTAVLSRLVPSPNGKRAALSYGDTFTISNIDPNTAIIILDLSNYKMTLRPEKGLVNSWKDDTTLLYELTSGNTQEIKL